MKLLPRLKITAALEHNLGWGAPHPPPPSPRLLIFEAQKGPCQIWLNRISNNQTSFNPYNSNKHLDLNAFFKISNIHTDFNSFYEVSNKYSNFDLHHQRIENFARTHFLTIM